MPRKQREKSIFGIYHVMLRGINKQNIFFNEDDFLRMMQILHDIPYIKDEDTGVQSSNRCNIYAYCILNNHLHLLIREGEQSLSEIMKIIEVTYVGYYNKKYQRIGHLFQGRFESEAVNDDTYFRTVLRYIALNPVKALESPTAEEYPYSSWNEYVGHPSNVIKVLKPSCIRAVLKKYPLNELIDWINQYNEDKCLDMVDFYSVNSDIEAWDILSECCDIDNPEDFRSIDPQTQIHYLLEAIDHGISISQASRLGTVTRYQIQKAYSKKFGINSAAGSDPAAEKSVEQIVDCADYKEDKSLPSDGYTITSIQNKVRCIEGLGKKTYHNLHLIVEFLASHPMAKCSDIAEFLNISNEGARRHLILLVNENIILLAGSKKNRIYALQNCGINSAAGSDPVDEKSVE